jgi:hypothetical protein
MHALYAEGLAIGPIDVQIGLIGYTAVVVMFKASLTIEQVDRVAVKG